MPVEKQVAELYAGVGGFLDDLEVGQLQAFTEELGNHLSMHHPDILKEIRERGELSEGLKKRLATVIEEIKKQSFSKNAVT